MEVRILSFAPINCLNCSKQLTDNQASPSRQSKFCSQECWLEFKNKKNIEKWLNGEIEGYRKGFILRDFIRRYLLEESNFKCSECGWDKINPFTGKCPLEIDHIDGDAKNTKKENLRVLCPNCHSLTPTWKNLNVGKSGKNRLRYVKVERKS